MISKLPLHLILVFILSCGVIFFQSQGYERNLRNGDSYIYLSIALDLKNHNTFTNGTFSKSEGVEAGNFFTPAYPVFLSSFMHFDQNFYQDAKCHIASKNQTQADQCGDQYNSVVAAQIILSVITALLIWLTAFLLTKNYIIAWLSLIIGLGSGVYGQYAVEIMTEALLFPLFALASLLTALAWRKLELSEKNWPLWLIAGAVFGFVVLTRPAYSYLIYASFPFLFLALVFVQKQNIISAVRVPLILFAGFILIISPWILRNGLNTGNYKVSEGYGPFVLVQRLAYNQMSWQEWRASFIYHLPDFGDDLAEKLFDKDAYTRFKYDNPEGFFYQGHTKLRDQVTNKVENKDDLLKHIVKNYLIADFSKHLAVTTAMIFNGLWIGKYWGLITIPLFFIALFFALKQRFYSLVVLAFPGFFMLGFHAFTSVNVTRYNMTLVPALSLAAAWVLVIFYSWLKHKMKKA